MRFAHSAPGPQHIEKYLFGFGFGFLIIIIATEIDLGQYFQDSSFSGGNDADIVLGKQFIVPILQDGRVVALLVMQAVNGNLLEFVKFLFIPAPVFGRSVLHIP